MFRYAHIVLSALLVMLATAYRIPGNEALCSATCPCGVNAPDWEAALPWLSGENSTAWCPLGCANAAGLPDESGTYVVDVSGGVCSPFAAWTGVASPFLLPYGCPLTDFWRLSLRWFTPCYNSSALAGGQVVCGPCLMPPAPPPDWPSPPALASPPGLQAITETLCLGLQDALNATRLALALSALLDCPATSISVITVLASDMCSSTPGSSPQAPAASGPLPAPGSDNTASFANVTAVSIAVATDAASAQHIADVLQRLAKTPAGRDALSSALQSPAQRSTTVASAPASKTMAQRLLPVRVLIAVLVSVPVCCCLPSYLLGTAAWRASLHSVCLVGIRGRMCTDATEFDRLQLATCCRALVLAFAHSQLRAPHVKALTLRMLTPFEAARFTTYIWELDDADTTGTEERAFLDRNHSLSTVGEDEEKQGGGRLVPDCDIQAVFELHVEFRWPTTARQWRSAVNGGLIAHELREAFTSAIDADLFDDCNDDDASQHSGITTTAPEQCQWRQLPVLLAHPPALSVSVALMIHRPPPCAPEDQPLGQPLRRLSRRRTLYVQEKPGASNCLESFPLV